MPPCRPIAQFALTRLNRLARSGPAFAIWFCAGLLAAWYAAGCSTCAYAHEPPPPPALRRASTAARRVSRSPGCRLEISLVDRDTHLPLPGVIQLLGADGQTFDLPELVNRGQGIEQEGGIHHWWVLPKPGVVTVPAETIEIRAFTGLESELSREHIDLTGRNSATLRLPITRFYRSRERGFVAGNTHLHLMKLSKQQADRYLREVALCDGLDVVFLSYLQRAHADLEYTSNNYSPRDLKALSTAELQWGHGEEHRHNFGSHGEGYGHILLLDIPYIIQPVSIGPGIMQAGVDAPPLQDGIDSARRAGGKVIWAHNRFGFEDIPNWVTGRVHANNIFDGSARGSYKDTYYRYLNVGLRVPFSTGTDWFIYDFSRAYVSTDSPLTPTEWLNRLAEGKSFITNGPLLEFTVDSQGVGSTIDLREPRQMKVRGRAVGRGDFRRIELVRNGQTVRQAVSHKAAAHFTAELDATIVIDAACWLALRTPPPPVEGDPELVESVGQNEFGGNLFAHTSPIYINLSGRGVFDELTARGLIAQMKSDWKVIRAKAIFGDPAQQTRVAQVYQEAIEKLQRQLVRQ